LTMFVMRIWIQVMNFLQDLLISLTKKHLQIIFLLFCKHLLSYSEIRRFITFSL